MEVLKPWLDWFGDGMNALKSPLIFIVTFLVEQIRKYAM